MLPARGTREGQRCEVGRVRHIPRKPTANHGAGQALPPTVDARVGFLIARCQSIFHDHACVRTFLPFATTSYLSQADRIAVISRYYAPKEALPLPFSRLRALSKESGEVAAKAAAKSAPVYPPNPERNSCQGEIRGSSGSRRVNIDQAAASFSDWRIRVFV